MEERLNLQIFREKKPLVSRLGWKKRKRRPRVGITHNTIRGHLVVVAVGSVLRGEFEDHPVAVLPPTLVLP
jgi:hypothetical protein